MRGGRWLRTRIASHLARWVPRLGLLPWTLTVRYRPTKRAAREFARANALCIRNASRMSAELFFNLRTIARDAANDRELEEIVVHELVHAVAGLNERETNIIARALVTARRGE